MGKHKKFLKSEKAKVKLKGTKLKSAGQNVTKTDFKVKKIILTEQLKNVQTPGIDGKKKVHNISDCLARLNNSTSPEAISNLKDIILYQPDDFQKNLEAIIKVVANLSMSIEKNVRRDCFKILDIICNQTNEFILRPFFSILLTYLKCAMTHIKPAIQEDSLIMFDILLKNAPKLVASQKDHILSIYLDMISKMRTDNHERTLSIQLGNKITNMKWRKSVLERLIVFLKCINSQQTAEIDSGTSKVRLNAFNEINVDEKNMFICNPYYKTVSTIDVRLSSFEHLDDSLAVLKSIKNESIGNIGKYINMIMPLMYETWMELKPSNESSTANISSISQESAQTLKLVMDIQLELFNMIGDDLVFKQQFLKKYQDSFEKQIMLNFPYHIQNDEGLKKTREYGVEKCIYQNLSIAIMFIHFSIKNPQRFLIYRERCQNFIEEIISMWKTKDQEFNFLTKKLVRILFTRESQKIFGNDLKRIFTLLVQKCNVDQVIYDPKLALVCEIIENNPDWKQTDNDNLLTQMIQVLAEREFIPVYLIKTITLLAKKGNKIVHKAIEKNALSIIKNLQNKLKITGILDASPDECRKWKMEVINLLYWINDADILMNLRSLPKTNETISIQIHQLISLNS